ncbi:MAG TPA: hypothetical protein VFA04_04195 [Bryobacteraceae bacterium]|nr:hypothetical protein [Bryobacteraceae bacterium]
MNTEIQHAQREPSPTSRTRIGLIAAPGPADIFCVTELRGSVYVMK